jgi:hypothetical protein
MRPHVARWKAKDLVTHPDKHSIPETIDANIPRDTNKSLIACAVVACVLSAFVVRFRCEASNSNGEQQDCWHEELCRCPYPLPRLTLPEVRIFWDLFVCELSKSLL